MGKIRNTLCTLGLAATCFAAGLALAQDAAPATNDDPAHRSLPPPAEPSIVLARGTTVFGGGVSFLSAIHQGIDDARRSHDRRREMCLDSTLSQVNSKLHQLQDRLEQLRKAIHDHSDTAVRDASVVSQLDEALQDLRAQMDGCNGSPHRGRSRATVELLTGAPTARRQRAVE